MTEEHWIVDGVIDPELIAEQTGWNFMETVEVLENLNLRPEDARAFARFVFRDRARTLMNFGRNNGTIDSPDPYDELTLDQRARLTTS